MLKGHKMSLEIKKKISISLKGRKHGLMTQEHKDAIRRCLTGRKRSGDPKNWKHTKKTKIKMRMSQLGKKQSSEHIRKRVEKLIGQKRTSEGKNHWNWKDGDIGKKAKHDRIEKLLGKPNYCEHCKKSDKKRYHWSNKDHKYSCKLQDWQRLCASCHKKYDLRYNNLRTYFKNIN